MKATLKRTIQETEGPTQERCERNSQDDGKGNGRESQGGRPGTQLSEGRAHAELLLSTSPGVGQWIREVYSQSQSERINRL